MEKVVGRRECVEANSALRPMWSPDGVRLAYSRAINGKDLHSLCIYDTRLARRWTDVADSAIFAWAPDSMTLIVVVFAPDGSQLLCSARLSGPERLHVITTLPRGTCNVQCTLFELRQLATDKEAPRPLWSVQTEPTNRVYRIDPETLTLVGPPLTCAGDITRRSLGLVARYEADTESLTVVRDADGSECAYLHVARDLLDDMFFSPGNCSIALAEPDSPVVRIVRLAPCVGWRTSVVYNRVSPEYFKEVVRCTPVGWFNDSLLVVRERILSGTARVIVLDVSDRTLTKKVCEFPVCPSADIVPCPARSKDDRVFALATAGECGVQILTVCL